jgi:hypothetical protein
VSRTDAVATRRYEYTTDSAGATWYVLGDARAMARTKITSSTSAVSIETTTGLSVTFTADGTTEYELMFTGQVTGSVAADRVGIQVYKVAGAGPATTSDTLVGANVFIPTTAGVSEAVCARFVDTPSAGSYTYTPFYKRAAGSGTVQIVAAATIPAIFSARPFA